MAFQIGNIIKAVYSKLSTDSTLNSLVTNIYISSMPKNATFPCIVVGNNDLLETTFNVFGKKGKETIVNIYVYNASNSDLETVGIAERIDTLLDWKSDLTISGCTHIKTAIQESILGYDINTSNATEMRTIKLKYKITTDET